MSEQDPKQALIDESCRYVGGLVEDKKQCPYCGYNNAIESNKQKVLVAHLIKDHPSKAVLAYEQQTLQPTMPPIVAADAPLLEKVGLEVTDDIQSFSYLAIDPKLKKQVEANGDVLRWVSPEKANYWMQQGAASVPYTGPEHTKKQNSTEDGTIRANETILMRLPVDTVIKRRKAKEVRQIDNLVGKAEDIRNKDSDSTAHEVYSRLLEQGMDRAKAQQVADSVSRGKKSGRLQEVTTGDGFVRVQDQQGTRTLKPG
jgi:hypothetical protein